MEEEMQEGKLGQAKRIKDLIAVIILLLGAFAGSLFVDFSQLFNQGGFSAKNLNETNIFEAKGKTWVAYSEPAITVKVISDDTCEKCSVDEVLVWLRRIAPTISTEKVDYASEEGEKLMKKFSLKTLPVFVFDEAITKTDFYAQAEVLFDNKDGQFVLKNSEIGIPVGKYVEAPVINDNDMTVGLKNSKVKVVVFSDFQCPYCKIFHKSLNEVIKSYSDRVLFDYKFFPLESHSVANVAALAGACAGEQGKFWEYADKLYDNQTTWVNEDITNSKLKEYARSLKLDVAKFNGCFDDKKYQEKINQDTKEAESLGLVGTPGVFVNLESQDGVISPDQLKDMIERELNK